MMKQVAKWSVLVYTECFEGLLGLSTSIVSDMQYNESNLHLHDQHFSNFSVPLQYVFAFCIVICLKFFKKIIQSGLAT